MASTGVSTDRGLSASGRGTGRRGFAAPQPVTSATPSGRFGGDGCGRSNRWVRPLRFCGVAFTVKTRPVDNLVVWKALELAQPGDVHRHRHGGPPRPLDLGRSHQPRRRRTRAGGDGHRRRRAGRGQASPRRGCRSSPPPSRPTARKRMAPARSTCRSPAAARSSTQATFSSGIGDGVVVVPRDDAAAALIELERIRAYEAERLEAIARGEFFPARARPAARRARRRVRRHARADDRDRPARRRLRRAHPARLLARGSATPPSSACGTGARSGHGRSAAEFGVRASMSSTSSWSPRGRCGRYRHRRRDTSGLRAAGGGMRQARPLPEATRAEPSPRRWRSWVIAKRPASVSWSTRTGGGVPGTARCATCSIAGSLAEPFSLRLASRSAAAVATPERAARNSSSPGSHSYAGCSR